MKPVIGLVMIVLGVILGLYVGIWVCFVGGIYQIITAVAAPQLAAWPLAVGIGKVMFAGVAGWVSAGALILPGIAVAFD